MPSISRFISVLSKVITNGGLTLTVASENQDSSLHPYDPFVDIDPNDPAFPPYTYPISFDVPITGLTTTMRPKDIAAQITSQVNTFLNNSIGTGPNNTTIKAYYLYNGIPQFYGEPIPFNFRVLQCDHIVNFWSQSQYSISIKDGTNTCGVELEIAEVPVFVTIDEARNLAPTFGVEFVTTKGDDFTDGQLKTALIGGSQQIIAYMGGFVAVASTYLHLEKGNYSDAMQLDYYPVISWDHPFVRGPKILNATGMNGIQLTADYEVDSDIGQVTFSGASIVPYYITPLDYDNTCKMTYCAGLQTVHPILKQETVRIAGFNAQPLKYESIKMGSASAKFRDPDDIISIVQANLARVVGR